MKIGAVAARDVASLLDALTIELSGNGYDESQTFGYSVEMLEAADVHLFGASVGDAIVAVGGVEVAGDGSAELKRFYVSPEYRRSGLASAILTHLIDYASRRGIRVLRLETGNKQRAAIQFYARHGFVPIDRFGPYVRSATSVCMARYLQP